MEATLEATDTKQRFINGLEKQALANNIVYQQVREEALKALSGLEFPTSKTEEWKYTRLGSLLKQQFGYKEHVDEVNLEIFNIADLEANKVVLINGVVSAKLSSFGSTSGIKICTLAAAFESNPQLLSDNFGQYADHKNEIFTALNTAYLTDGVVIEISDNCVAEKPIHIIQVINGEQVAAQPRVFLYAGKSSKVKVVHSFHTLSGNGFTNAVSEIIIQENAEVEYNLMQLENTDSFHINTIQVYQKKDSRFTSNTITLGGKLVRNNLNIVPDSENCFSTLNGLYLPAGEQHFDNHTLVDHKKPHCESHELYKGIIDNKATAVFNGKVFVRPNAQKTNAFQSNANILLSDDATINSKPELEIYADDVKCSHGSTTGQLDDEALFYLRTRGMKERDAKKLLLRAFAGDVLDKLTIDPLRNITESLIEERWKK